MMVCVLVGCFCSVWCSMLKMCGFCVWVVLKCSSLFVFSDGLNVLFGVSIMLLVR